MLACTGNHEIEAESDGKNSIFTSVQARWKVPSIAQRHWFRWYLTNDWYCYCCVHFLHSLLKSQQVQRVSMACCFHSRCLHGCLCLRCPCSLRCSCFCCNNLLTTQGLQRLKTVNFPVKLLFGCRSMSSMSSVQLNSGDGDMP